MTTARTPTPPARVGVVVITRDRRDGLLHTLDRLAALPEHPPLVVVDNASTDGTADAVRARHPQAQVLTLRVNRGAAARTAGAFRLSTPYVAFSDDDSWWHPGALDTAGRLLDTHPRLALIAAATRVGPEQRPDPMDELLAASPLGTEDDLPGPSVLGFLACASVVRREAFLRAGGFHPVLHFGGEETLLALDLAADGWGIAHCADVVAHHHPDPTPKPGRDALLRRNHLLTVWLRRPWRRVAGDTACLMREAATDPQARRALTAALPRLPAALLHRRPLPPRVERSARLVGL